MASIVKAISSVFQSPDAPSIVDDSDWRKMDGSALAALPSPIADKELALMNEYWHAANYLTVGQIYLRENALLREPLKVEHIKPRLLGHWGTSPGLSLIYLHANRLIKRTNDDFILLVGPGHGGPAIVANTYLEGTWNETYPKNGITATESGMRKLFRQFSAPGGIPSHCSPDVPGSIHEGGELGYVLTHAFGSVMDNPDLVALAVVGDGEAETGPLEGSWKGITFINPKHDGAVLPILHLNGYKIGGPTVLGRSPDDNIRALLSGHGYEVLFVEGTDPLLVHVALAKALDYALAKIRAIQKEARTTDQLKERPRWPAIILRTPKGWTGPHDVDGKTVEGTQFAHQVPLSGVREKPEHLQLLEKWLHSYKPEVLFTPEGGLRPDLLALAPEGGKRLSAQNYVNGGKNARSLVVPDLAAYAVEVKKAGNDARSCSVIQLGKLTRDLYKENPTNFRFFCPDESNSNKFTPVFETQKRGFMLPTDQSKDDRIGPDGRVMELLSEHNANGWLEGYILTGRHGILATYEAFAMVFVSMTSQMVKWLEVVRDSPKDGGLSWRKSLPSINILLTSTCWRNDHNGFSHQGPGFLDALIGKRGSVVRAYLPPDANCLLVTAEHVFGTQNRVNIIVQDKQDQLQYLTLPQAREHFKQGMSRWAFASNDEEGQGAGEPDVIFASCGDVLTMEALAAVQFLRERCPQLKIRFVNILDLMRLATPERHPHGAKAEDFAKLFTTSVHVVVAFHSYPAAFHQLVHDRPQPTRFHVRGYTEHGTTTTPFDMTVVNRVSRFHLAALALEKMDKPPANAAEVIAECKERVETHKTYVVEHMEDQHEIVNWKWTL